MEAVADPAVLDVARAIYYWGRADGLPGLEAMAHVIQNRCCHPDFPFEAQAVVLAGIASVPQAQRANQTPRTTAERQLFGQAKRLAVQLVHPPRRLPFPDPTGGAVYYDQGPTSNTCGFTRPLGGSAALARPLATTSAGSADNTESGDHLPEEDAGTVQRPRASPQSCRLLYGLRDGGSRRANLGSSTSTAPNGAAMLQRNVAAGGSASPTPPANGHPTTTTAAVPPGQEGVLPPTMVTMPRALPPPQQPLPSPPVRPRPLGGQHYMLGGGPVPQRTVVGGLRRGPADENGYHDVVLACGLMQEEIIELMYRDLNPEDFETLNKLDERLPRRNIVQHDLMEGLPRRLASECNCSECGVCLAELDPGARVVQLPCGHGFHPACISRWLTQCKNTCPLCAARIDVPQSQRAVDNEYRARGSPGSSSNFAQVQHTI